MNSNRGENQPKKDAYYRLLSNPRHSWRRFLSILSGHIVHKFEALTSSARVRVLILDDSVISRNRSKKTELLSWVFDHTKGYCVKGFQLLTLGWSDVYSFIPVDFALHSSASERSRLVGIDNSIDKRTVGYKRRVESQRKKPEVSVSLIDSALASGINADYVVMDSWFTNEPMLKALKARNLNVIGMIKDNKQCYTYGSFSLTLKELYKRIPDKRKRAEIIGSVLVSTKQGIRVKLVFVRNRNNRSEWLAILCTDTTVEDAEIIRIYGIRWGIEVFFKSAKSLLKLGKEFHGKSYDSLIAHTTIVFSRYILLEWERRNHTDDRTIGGLFFLFSDEVRDIDLKTALHQLMKFFLKLKNLIPNAIDYGLIRQVMDWVDSQPSYIKDLLPVFYCES